MPATHSVTYIATAADRDAVNAFCASLGWGDYTLTVQLSPTGEAPATHYGAHDRRSGEFVAALVAAQESDDPLLAPLDSVLIYAIETEAVGFHQAIVSDECVAKFGTTLQIYYPPVEV